MCLLDPAVCACLAPRLAPPLCTQLTLACTLPPTLPGPPAVVAQGAGGAECPGVGPPRATMEAVQAAVFDASSPTSVTSFFAGCSNGQAQLHANNSEVAEPVVLPCFGSQ